MTIKISMNIQDELDRETRVLAAAFDMNRTEYIIRAIKNQLEIDRRADNEKEENRTDNTHVRAVRN